jgi:polyhydroxyalkanoate synthase subunit PhaC
MAEVRERESGEQQGPAAGAGGASPPQDGSADGHGMGAAALDLLLTEAGTSLPQRFIPGRESIKLAARLARRPRTVLRRSTELGGELGRIMLGRSDREPPRADRRFKDPAWSANWLLHRLLQSYLAIGDSAVAVIGDAELDWNDDQKLRFIASNLLDALAPSNSPVLNPEVLKATIDTGGANFVRGAQNLLRDLTRPPRLPANVDRRKFKVGENLALTAGAVVLKDERFELIQYEPATSEVRSTPLLIVPPMVNKFYIMDLAPGKSVIEYFLGRGQQVFSLSWRNPREAHRGWGLDEYAAAVLDALDAVQSITGVEQTNLIGNCAGGLLASTVAAHLADVGELERLASLTLGVCVIDNEHSNVVNAWVGPRGVKLAKAASARKGYLDGNDLASVFLWLRPNDLIWPYVVNNWMLGEDPPAFDILYWNADVTRMPAALHSQFIDIAAENRARQPGGITVLGSPVDLSQITVDSYLVAGIADHIAPWQNCYRTTQLLGGTKRFVLSTSGHIAAIVNPPGNERATFRTCDEQAPPDAETWFQSAGVNKGTWWTDWDTWLAKRSGALKPAPRKLGNRRYPPVGAAPGEYVHET